MLQGEHQNTLGTSLALIEQAAEDAERALRALRSER